MRRWLCLAVLLSIACAHARNANQNRTGRSPASENKEPTKPGEPPLTASPKGILEPGAVEEIQEALRKKGYEVPRNGLLEGPTEHGLEKFQKSESLPETGLPDRETLRQLGLDPDKIYRANPRKST